MEKSFNNMFSNPFEIFEAFKNVTENSSEIIENNIKYRKACVAYNQSILDMMEAINDNNKILNKKGG